MASQDDFPLGCCGGLCALAVGIGWSVWLPGTREGRMMPDGQEQGVQAVQLLLSDGSRHELGPGRLSGSIPGFRVDTGGVIRQEAVASGPGGDTVRYGEIMVPRVGSIGWCWPTGHG